MINGDVDARASAAAAAAAAASVREMFEGALRLISKIDLFRFFLTQVRHWQNGWDRNQLFFCLLKKYFVCHPTQAQTRQEFCDGDKFYWENYSFLHIYSSPVPFDNTNVTCYERLDHVLWMNQGNCLLTQALNHVVVYPLHWNYHSIKLPFTEFDEWSLAQSYHSPYYHSSFCPPTRHFTIGR